jgi:hypothetical protein
MLARHETKPRRKMAAGFETTSDPLIVAASAEVVIGPTPGIVASRGAVSFLPRLAPNAGAGLRRQFRDRTLQNAVVAIEKAGRLLRGASCAVHSARCCLRPHPSRRLQPIGGFLFIERFGRRQIRRAIASR